jgi:hypothetical protein
MSTARSKPVPTEGPRCGGGLHREHARELRIRTKGLIGDGILQETSCRNRLTDPALSCPALPIRLTALQYSTNIHLAAAVSPRR